MEEIIGKIIGIPFSNRDSGFHILKIDTDGKSDPIAAKGDFLGVSLSSGLRIRLVGKWQEHQKYGKQFLASSFELVKDPGKTGVVSYLIANVKSIGPITAAKLYDEFGDKLFEVLEKESDKVVALPFLTKAQSRAILEEWSTSSENRSASIFLADAGLTRGQIKQFLTDFGAKNAKSILNNNPYVLTKLDGVGFPTADHVAEKMGVRPDDSKRVIAMVQYAISELSFSEGHTYVVVDQIKNYISKKLFSKNSLAPFSHGQYVTDTQLYSSLDELSGVEIFIDHDKIYLTVNWDNESQSASKLAKISLHSPYSFKRDLELSLQDFESVCGFSLSVEQRLSFLSLGKSRAIVISGYPGTGKTTLISAFVHLFEKENLDYSLISPTGIAAKRLSQVTSRPASTIHRKLKFNGKTWEFNSKNKYHVDAIVLDEMSMVDSATFCRLLDALPDNVIIIMVGDSAQLPSVGAGCVLGSLMKSSEVSHTSLTRIYRQDAVSDIIRVAHKIQKFEPIDTSFNKASEFVFFNIPDDKVMEEVKKLSRTLKNKDFGFQVMAPMYDGDLGINALNINLREVLNPSYEDGQFIKHGLVNLYEGDRIMFGKNDYERMIFNGDTGKIQKISIKEDKIEVRVFEWFDELAQVDRYSDKIFTFTLEEARTKFRVAYAISVHRSQGKEFDYVILPMTMKYNIMLYKNLIYTAITRAKKKVFLFGDSKAFLSAVSNDRESMRNSQLTKLISDFVKSHAVNDVHTT